MISVQSDMPGVNIERVDRLYAQFARMDVPDYYDEGEENPFAGRCRVIPRTATFYTMVPASDEDGIEAAAMILKSVAKRKKVRFTLCEKHEINFNQFAPAGKVVVMFV